MSSTRSTQLVRESGAGPPSLARTLTVYLAGGFRSGWQERVYSALRDLNYKDPSKHGLTDPALYTEWDLQAIRECDVVFAYLEATNPAGYALALEVGYAKALGKSVILVDEKSSHNKQAARYLEMLRCAADAAFDSFDEGVQHLQRLAARR